MIDEGIFDMWRSLLEYLQLSFDYFVACVVSRDDVSHSYKAEIMSISS